MLPYRSTGALSFLSPLVLLVAVATTARADPLPTADGYRGIGYSNQPSNDEYKFKYSGGFAT